MKVCAHCTTPIKCTASRDCALETRARRQDAQAEFVQHIDHPEHYGGANNPYEAIKVIDAWELNFSLGNVVKYVCRHGKKAGITDEGLRDLKKALWYLNHEINEREKARAGRS